MKKYTAIPNIITAGIKNTMLIKLILITAINAASGPSTVSIKAKNKLLSIVPKSFESLFTSTPEGVKSKKLEGLLNIDVIIF